MTTRGEGIFLDMSEADYRSAPGVNVSSLKDMRLSPAHYKHWQEAPDKDKTNTALIIGTLTHRAKLEPHKFCYAVRPEQFDSWRTKESKAWRDAQKLPVVTPDEEQAILRCVDALTGLEVFPGITLDDLCEIGNTEVKCFKRHPRTGLMMKGAADLVATDENGTTYVIDLKTVPEEGASEDKFSRKIADLNYHMQAAYYCDLFAGKYVCNSCGAEYGNKTHQFICGHCGSMEGFHYQNPPRFIFIAVEKAGFPGVAAWELDAEDLEIGRRTNEALLEQLSRCIKTGEWNGYHKGVRTIRMPGWKRKQDGRDIE